jgi:hypothetical protein
MDFFACILSNNKAINSLDPLTFGFALEIKQDSGGNQSFQDYFDIIIEGIEIS